jgi:hypothetical protein
VYSGGAAANNGNKIRAVARFLLFLLDEVFDDVRSI